MHEDKFIRQIPFFMEKRANVLPYSTIDFSSPLRIYKGSKICRANKISFFMAKIQSSKFIVGVSNK